MLRKLIFITFLFGCTPPGEPGELVSSDVRLDGASSENDPDSFGTVLCKNENGNAFVGWIDDRDGQSDIWVNRSIDAGRSWMPAPVKINRGDGDVYAVDMACTNDAVYVVWEDDRDGELENHQIYFNRSNATGDELGEIWEDDDILLESDPDGLSMSLGPKIEASATDVYVTWFDSQNGAYDIFVASSDNGGRTWREVVRADRDDPGSSYSAWPEMAITPYGDIYIAWEDARDGANDIYVGVSRDHGQSFKTERRIDTGEAKGKNHSFAPRLDADDDTVYVVWHDSRGGDKRDIFMNYSTDYGDTWLNAAERVETDNIGAFDSLYPTVAVRGETAHIVWSDAHSGGYDVYYRQAVQGGLTGDEAIRLDTDPAGYANSMNTDIAVGESTVIVAWQDGRDDSANEGYNDLYYNFSRDNGAAWNELDMRVDSMESGSAYKVDLNVALHRQEFMMAWTDGRNGTGDVFFHHMKVGEEAAYQAVVE